MLKKPSRFLSQIASNLLTRSSVTPTGEQRLIETAISLMCFLYPGFPTSVPNKAVNDVAVALVYIVGAFTILAFVLRMIALYNNGHQTVHADREVRHKFLRYAVA